MEIMCIPFLEEAIIIQKNLNKKYIQYDSNDDCDEHKTIKSAEYVYEDSGGLNGYEAERMFYNICLIK